MVVFLGFLYCVVIFMLVMIVFRYCYFIGIDGGLFEDVIDRVYIIGVIFWVLVVVVIVCCFLLNFIRVM